MTVNVVGFVTDLKSPASPRLVAIADPLQLTSSRHLPEDKLQTSPQTFAVQKHKKLCQHPAMVCGKEREE